MAFNISEITTSYFITNKIELPRFQRKATWKDIDNFKLCMANGFQLYTKGLHDGHIGHSAAMRCQNRHTVFTQSIFLSLQTERMCFT